MRDVQSSVTHSANDPDGIRADLADRVRAAVETSSNGSPRVFRVTVPLEEPVDPLGWLKAQSVAETVYWSGRDDDHVVAGIGAADVVSQTEAPLQMDTLRTMLDRRLRAADGSVRYYGGLRFDGTKGGSSGGSEAWAPFGTARFVLPRFELLQANGDAHLACNVVCPRDSGRTSAILEAIQQLSVPTCPRRESVPRPVGRMDVPAEDRWTDMVCWALDAIDADALQKVVFARRVALDFEDVLDPFVLLKHLQEATPGCFHFALRPQHGGAFLGASPERLFRRRGRRVLSEAVAGTRGRGETETADAALREELMQSPKERREHAIVQKAIRGALAEVCTSVEEPETPSDFTLARGRHLHAKIGGCLRPDTTSLDLLHKLHPTPAVGGVPGDDALEAIRQQEPFDRGWYAGPVGWVGAEAAEFAVAIRSGLVRDEQLDLYSGAGLVEGSVPEREWAEIEQKIGDFTAILGIETASDAAG